VVEAIHEKIFIVYCSKRVLTKDHDVANFLAEAE
jgi:hypothetical protein